ncbi:TetR/AcrR family transcriptional regulator [Nocardia sp. alder85J]|uniref:TetR/AcrR family transcriptional regulator n=1 Tax=Nocardia sp. alder85J TaxID=2862949 RepID=UPI001CD62D09|nr:TetR/AcrR family transcriptional regulator [Nocardia sp. alder85J]MCX4098598.1 TetR/AcrR family transcriptional regulator [Nocardia sp. alder85J]
MKAAPDITSPATASGPGRPRDPGVDRRVLEAAINIYGELGWHGFSIEAVARGAGVGKATIYRRWPNRTDLLIDAVRARVAVVAHAEAGDVRTELLELTRNLLRNYLADYGRSTMRLTLEAHLVPGLEEHWDEVRSSQILAARSIVQRAVDRGQLPPETSVTLLLDTLSGAVLMHAQAVPPQLRARQAAQADAYAGELVDFVLGAVRARPDA